MVLTCVVFVPAHEAYTNTSAVLCVLVVLNFLVTATKFAVLIVFQLLHTPLTSSQIIIEQTGTWAFFLGGTGSIATWPETESVYWVLGQTVTLWTIKES